MNQKQNKAVQVSDAGASQPDRERSAQSMKSDLTRSGLREWRSTGLRQGGKTTLIAIAPLVAILCVTWCLQTAGFLARPFVRFAAIIASLGTLIWMSLACWRGIPLVEREKQDAPACPACGRKFLGRHLDWAIWFGKCSHTGKRVFTEEQNNASERSD